MHIGYWKSVVWGDRHTNRQKESMFISKSQEVSGKFETLLAMLEQKVLEYTETFYNPSIKFEKLLENSGIFLNCLECSGTFLNFLENSKAVNR